MAINESHVRNLNRWLWVCVAVAIFSLTLLSAVLAVRLIPDRYETALGDFPSPVVLNRVPGSTDAGVHLGDVLILRQDHCINRNTSLDVQTGWIWAGSGSAPTPSTIPNPEHIKGPAVKGCTTSTLSLPMPDQVMPGIWVIAGAVRDVPSGDFRYWSSDPFTVLP